MPMSPAAVVALTEDVLFPQWRADKERLDRIDRWYRWDHDKPHKPRQATSEYQELQARAQTPWLALVVTTVAQALYVEGYRSENEGENATPWRLWQANGMDARQIAIHRAALAYGLSYVTVLPGKDMDGGPMPVVRGVSPRQMIAVYQDPAEDEWPMYALRVEAKRVNGAPGYRLRVYDDEVVYELLSDGVSKPTYVEFREHNADICPVVRFANQLDLEGRADGEVEPFIPLAGRIDQTTFDRLVVQRFASWVVRTIAGMAKPDSQAEAEAEKLRLKVEDLLVSEHPDTKFGSLPATSLDGFIKAREADIGDLSAVSQTPAHELLGQLVNLNAEALAAARATFSAKVDERKHTFGESHEQWLRLGAVYLGDSAAARDVAAQVRWKDTEIRSLAQAADALGKLAQMLGVPVELLWEKVPGFTQQDVDRAKTIVQEGGAIESLMRELLNGQSSAEDDQVPDDIAA